MCEDLGRSGAAINKNNIALFDERGGKFADQFFFFGEIL